jgi:hypothetical protein
MPHATRPRRLAGPAALLALLAALALAPEAAGASWSLEGRFDRASSPGFGGGFPPDEVDEIALAYDDRAKRVDLRLRLWATPSRGAIEVAAGTALADGTCEAGAAIIAIEARDVLRTRTEVATEAVWVPDRHRWETSYRWPGTGWTYLGWDDWRRQHRWLRPGHWERRTTSREVVEVDPDRHERVARLTRQGVHGHLEAHHELPTGGVEMAWSFASPLLDDLAADCLEVTVPDRAEPYVVAPAPSAGTPDDEPIGDEEEVELDGIEATARRRGTRVLLLLSGGEADRIGVRANGRARSLPFRPRVALRGVPARSRSLLVRFEADGAWSDWEAVTIR